MKKYYGMSEMIKLCVTYGDHSCEYVASHDYFNSHVVYIKHNKSQCAIGNSYPRTSYCNSNDFDSLIQMGKLFVELIEYLRPDVILKC